MQWVGPNVSSGHELQKRLVSFGRLKCSWTSWIRRPKPVDCHVGTQSADYDLLDHQQRAAAHFAVIPAGPRICESAMLASAALWWSIGRTEAGALVLAANSPSLTTPWGLLQHKMSRLMPRVGSVCWQRRHRASLSANQTVTYLPGSKRCGVKGRLGVVKILIYLWY